MLAKSGLSQIDAARALSVDGRTVRRWCQPPGSTGYRKAPPMAAMALQYHLEHYAQEQVRSGLRGIAWLSSRIQEIEKTCRTVHDSPGWSFSIRGKDSEKFTGFPEMRKRRVVEVVVACLGEGARELVEEIQGAESLGDAMNLARHMLKAGLIDVDPLRGSNAPTTE